MDVQVMVFWCRVVAAALAGVGLVLLVCAGARWRPRLERKFCPGLPVRGLRRLNPARLLVSRVCGYDLSGLPTVAGGGVVCPECGGRLRVPSGALRSAARWRPGRLGVTVVVMAGVVLCGPMLKTKSWQRLVPTTVLIGVKRGVGTEWMPTRLRRELDRRLERKELWGWQARWVIPALQRDLRKDRSPRNAHRAIDLLNSMGEEGRAALERSLAARDYQGRQLAAYGLRQRCWDRTDYKNPKLVREPSDELLRVTVEGLQSDKITYVNGGTDNAWAGFSFLAQFPSRIEPFVGGALQSDDKQQRLLCAALVAHAGLESLYDAAVPILIEHLAGNTMSGDAILAARALSWAGTAAAEKLVQAFATGDSQQRQLAKLLLKDLGQGSMGGFEKSLYRHIHGGRYDSVDGWEPSWCSIGGLGWTPRRLGGVANTHWE